VILRAKDAFEGGQAPDSKSESKVLRDAMKKILPDYDAERVYDSDIRKLLTWYNILQAQDMLDFAEPAADAEPAANAEPATDAEPAADAEAGE